MGFGVWKLFLIVGYSILVASIFLPFASVISQLSSFPPLFEMTLKESYWSFMHILEPLEKSGEPPWTIEYPQTLYFMDYWDWWGRGTSGVLPSTVLIPMFILQVAAVFQGCIALIFALKKDKAGSMLPLFLSAIVLTYVYSYMAQVKYSELTIGFWASLVATVLLGAAIVQIVLFRKVLQRKELMKGLREYRHLILFYGLVIIAIAVGIARAIWGEIQRFVEYIGVRYLHQFPTLFASMLILGTFAGALLATYVILEVINRKSKTNIITNQKPSTTEKP